MKQPELGQKISELRKAKGLTQEELVEKCNISVRTIQRIETGDVEPRSYTIKTILDALEADLELLESEEAGVFKQLAKGFRNLLLIDINLNKPSTFLYKQLNIAWVFGIIYFAVGFLESTADYYRIVENELLFDSWIYVLIKVVVLISFIFFQRGFVMLGGLFNNYLLKISSVILIASSTIIIIYDIASLYYSALDGEFIMVASAITFGLVGIIYGIALYKLKSYLGQLAQIAGVFEIIAGGLFITVIFAFAGFIVLVPAELFEIILIFKAIHLLKRQEKKQL